MEESFLIKRLRLEKPDGTLSSVYNIGAEARDIEVENNKNLDEKIRDFEQLFRNIKISLVHLDERLSQTERDIEAIKEKLNIR